MSLLYEDTGMVLYQMTKEDFRRIFGDRTYLALRAVILEDKKRIGPGGWRGEGGANVGKFGCDFMRTEEVKRIFNVPH